MLHTALGAAAAVVALAFALSTLERWLAARRPQELAWTAALVMFSLASAFLAAGAAGGWNEPVFKLFWYFGAVANVPFLALGTVYLLFGRRAGNAWAVAIALAVAFAGGVITTAPLQTPIPVDELPRGSEVLGVLPRVLAAVASGGGAVVVIGGALWSAVRYRRGRMVWANVLIALGTAVTGASGLLNSVMDEMTGFAVFLVAGIVIIFSGFLVASSSAVTAAPVAAPSRPDLVGATPRT